MLIQAKLTSRISIVPLSKSDLNPSDIATTWSPLASLPAKHDKTTTHYRKK